ncbi:hypothetical protein FOZ63_021184, partial [Perkinsus olseni]
LDYQAAYRQLPVRHDEAKFLAVKVKSPNGDGRTIAAVNCRLPFGQRALTRPLLSASSCYVDDIVVMSPASIAPFLLAVYTLLIVFLGFRFRVSLLEGLMPIVSVPTAKAQAIQQDIGAILESGRILSGG